MSGPFRHYALRIAYDGAAFAGFQRQVGQRTIQSAIEAELERALGEHVAIQGASRTDAGVHARAQVASFKVRFELDIGAVARRLDEALAPQVRVTGAARAHDSFHARWSARGKTYVYRFGDFQPGEIPAGTPFGHPRLLHGASLRIDSMAVQRAVDAFPGRGLYLGMCGRGPAKMREVRRADVRFDGERIEMWFEGSSFGRFMVRNLAGLALAAGMGLFPLDAISSALQREQQLRGVRAPAQGLALWEVHYPAELAPRWQ